MGQHLRHRRVRPDQAHLRVDLPRRHQQPGAHAGRLVPAEHQYLRAVLRRGDQFRHQRRDVAVVRWRRHLQRVR
jgi:hypothetical protein